MFYVQKIGQHGSISIWLVDGYYVRKHLDEEFTNFGQHYRFKFIPENEFWIDRGASLEELPVFLDHLLVEHRLMKYGVPYEKALEIADRKERAERKRAGDTMEVPLKRDPNSELVHLKLLAETGDVRIWLVNGQLVRTLFDTDFTEGGHDLVYTYVPKGEVWIENDVGFAEVPYILLHELHERNLMKRGLSYNEAHAESSRLEYQVRHNQHELKEALKREMMKK